MKSNRWVGAFSAVFILFSACAPLPWQVTAVKPATATTAAQPVTDAAPTDSTAEQFIRPYRKRVVAEMSERIATNPEAMEKPGKLGNNAPLTCWVAGVLRAEAGRAMGTLPDFAALTNGSIRTGLPAGNVTVGNIYELMPFENELTVLALPGAVVQQLFDYAAKFDNLGAVNVTWTKTSDGKASDIRIGNRPLDPAATYTLAINDYLANGGDGMSFLKPLHQLPTKRTIRQAILDYLRREKTVRKFNE